MPEPSPVPAARPSAVVRTEPATFELVKNSLYAAAEEMKVVLAEPATPRPGWSANAYGLAARVAWRRIAAEP